ncbi:N-acetyltransferase ESCO2-like protein [Euroglyphus maynei]|uniref:N-acetyltransferase ESCO2-like protein n=1 Tax=Euroglyphus maynei TaxID=6958 RepID=A0A1Y3BEE9_EURMA|nr:N-acetyltransferase ESCO2-like protein [Euroglyphus maynei]
MSFLFESPVKTVEELPTLKYYPIFDKRWSSTVKTNVEKNGGKIKRPRSTGKINRKPYGRKKLFDSSEQYVLDFGQKNFDAKRCSTCNMLYTVGEIIDEKTHQEYHDMFVNSLKYREWKNEDVVNVFDDGRILRVLPSSPHYMHKKLDELFKIADIELGINVDLKSSLKSTSQFFIFISLPSKRIVGFVSAERIKYANKLLTENPLMASTDEYPAECGVSRIWTHPNFRRKRIATRLLDTLRQVFYQNRIIPLDRLAFSDPTMIGKDFAKSYTKMDQFLIYLYRHIIEQITDGHHSKID